ncbi:transcriptional regulator [Actinocatenispora thailandica]|uniref:Transcriptional regulator n=1 Tax=Actinocatenispora thailandica TaxID=227318 RepID=A0A7R7DKP1_9ACTN|nr:winged helix-turn-helix transcriptional regulator [Actinocatenispora thailandica]BCJ33520.1 transcriptional regulator [Actinocatenispora thailandica]
MRENGCETFVSECHVRAGVELLRHTWDPVVLLALRPGPLRRNVLLGRIAGVSDKALTESLRRLTARELVRRRSGEARRDVASYELTELGRSFANGPLARLAGWSSEHQAQLVETG